MRENDGTTIPTLDLSLIEPIAEGGGHGRKEVSKESGKKGCEEGRCL